MGSLSRVSAFKFAQQFVVGTSVAVSRKALRQLPPGHRTDRHPELFRDGAQRQVRFLT